MTVQQRRPFNGINGLDNLTKNKVNGIVGEGASVESPSLNQPMMIGRLDTGVEVTGQEQHWSELAARVAAGRATVEEMRLLRAERSHRRLVERYAYDGKPTPFDVMMSNLRFFHNESVRCTNRLLKMRRSRGVTEEDLLDLMRKIVRHRGDSQRCAKDAAPYMHATLSSVTLGSDPENPLPGSVGTPLIVQFSDPTEVDPGAGGLSAEVLEELGTREAEVAVAGDMDGEG